MTHPGKLGIWWLPCLYLVTTALTIWTAVTISAGQAERKRREDHAQDRRLAEVRRLHDCVLYGKIIKAYQKSPPTTPTGIGLYSTYVDLYNEIHCTPPIAKGK